MRRAGYYVDGRSMIMAPEALLLHDAYWLTSVSFRKIRRNQQHLGWRAFGDARAHIAGVRRWLMRWAVSRYALRNKCDRQ